MQIANPIYDVVFKYLMEDGKIAKIMLSSIIGEKIERLTFLSQEFVNEIDRQKAEITSKNQKINKITRKSNYTVYRLDFSAKIKTKEGYKQVIIELQKAKLPTDIMRFRNYLGEQFSNKENSQRIIIKDKTRKVGLPIISIYFLGHKLDYTQASAIKIERQYKDLITGEIIEVKESFIESLTLDSYVIQIPYLTDKRRNELEILLSVFDQKNVIDNEHHILNVNENDFPKEYSLIIRKLQEANQNTEIRKKMKLEDQIIDELQDLQRDIEELEQKIENIEQKLDTTQQEKEKAEQEKEKAEQKKEKAEQENKKLKEELEKFKNLYNDKK
jgi:hypothetical protein